MKLIKSLTIIGLSMTVIMSWFHFTPTSQISAQEKNFFESQVYSHYRLKMKGFITQHPAYEKIRQSSSLNHSTIQAIFEELNHDPVSATDQRLSHGHLIKNLREALAHFSIDEDSDSKQMLIDFINWLFLEADLKPDMQSFFYQYANFPEENLLNYLKKTQKDLHQDSRFDGLGHKPHQEDQFFEGNLPSFIALINRHTKLIRIGQPVCQIHYTQLLTSTKISPEFLFFIQQQPKHLYVNLMKRHGMEGALTNTLEELEGECPNFTCITLDKNSSFYWQDKKYPEKLESESFKQTFLDKMFESDSHYFWSKHLDLQMWKEEVKQIIQQIHQTGFNQKNILDREERQDFIELTYLAILNHLVNQWNPTSMNITCKQGIDRGPSLMVLWLVQQKMLNKQEIASLLLAPPLMIHNRSSHRSRIERFNSAAKRLHKNDPKW